VDVTLTSEVWKTHAQAAMSYRPQLYDGRIVVFVQLKSQPAGLQPWAGRNCPHV
jgi:hypothetical protein